MKSIPEERPMANCVGARNEAAESLVIFTACADAILLQAKPIPIGRMSSRLGGFFVERNAFVV